MEADSCRRIAGSLCRGRLIEGKAGHFTFKAFHAEIEQLRSDMHTDDGKKALLDKVAAFGAELESVVQAE